MQTKNKKSTFIIYLFSFLLFSLNAISDEFNITAKEITIDKENEIIIGKGSVEAIDKEGKIIKADKIIYKKLNEFLVAEGNVNVSDLDGNFLHTSKATYDKINEIISSFNF